jgi:DNA polymerase III delta prime subunit
MLLIDKYHIKNKEDITFHKEIYDKLFNNNYNDLPNLLIHGPQGSGKHTLINLLLKDIYGDDVNNIRNEIYLINEYGNNTKEIIIKQSNNHIVIEPNNNGLDKYIKDVKITEQIKNKRIVCLDPSNSDIFYAVSKDYIDKIIVENDKLKVIKEEKIIIFRYT